MTERVVMLQELDPDRVDEYLAAHEDVPEAVSDAMERGGVESFELYVRDAVSVGIIEVEDFEAYNEVYMDDPECREWERHVEQFKRSGVDPDSGEMPLMDEVWRFEADAE
ncbi:MAG: L-rhamnose mutarotase [Halobacteriaceae archaeon]